MHGLRWRALETGQPERPSRGIRAGVLRNATTRPDRNPAARSVATAPAPDPTHPRTFKRIEQVFDTTLDAE